MNNWLTWILLFACVWSIGMAVLFVINPRDIVSRWFEWNRNRLRVGRIRFGVAMTSRTVRQYRIQAVLVAIFTALLCGILFGKLV